MIKIQFVLFLTLLLFTSHSLSSTKLENVRASIDDEFSEFVIELNFNKSVDLTTIKVKHGPKKMNVTIPKVNIDSNDTELDIGDRDVNSIKVAGKKKQVELNVYFAKNVDGDIFKEFTRMEKDGTSVRLRFKRQSYILAKTKKLKKPVTPLVFSDDKRSLSSEKVRHSLLSEAGFKKGKAEKDIPLIVSDTQAKGESLEGIKDENEIPVLSGTKNKTEKESSSSLSSRLVLSLGIIFLFGIGALVFIKWWSKKHKLNEITNKIRVLTQHHLGPKKSLAIIRVAGESILIGITDGSINHIKTLSLIDDEIPPEKQSGNFKSQLDTDFYRDELSKNSDQDSFDYGDNINETIKSRLKELQR